MKFGLLNIILIICLIVQEHSVKGDFYDSARDWILQHIFGAAESNILGHIDKLCAMLLSWNIYKPTNPPVENEIYFQLRTPDYIESFSLSQVENILHSDFFDPNKKLVIFVSGWKIRPDKDYITTVENAYHCRGDSNFVVLNSARFIDTLYIWSAINTQKIGIFIGDALSKLVAQKSSLYIHLIGHSLGAQIVGSAGDRFLYLTKRKIPRITGLDPANPCFDKATAIPSIQRSDAEFVDIIHTNPGGFGELEPLGHIDFYVGGLDVLQTNCYKPPCSHELAIYYYAESVYPCNAGNFMAVPCRTLNDIKEHTCWGLEIPMGHDVPFGSEGLYYLTVNPEEPYGKNATYFSAGECIKC